MRYTGTYDSRSLTAIMLSLIAHGAFFAAWHSQAVTPVQLSAMKPIEVQLIARNAIQPTPTKLTPPRLVPVQPKKEPVPAPAQPVPSAEPTVATSAPSAPAPAETMVEARSDVASLNNPKPPYPPLALRNGIEGLVLLSVQVRSDGTPSEVNLKQTSGHRALDVSALDTVKRWRFVPARRGNTPVDSYVDVPVLFRLTKESRS